MKEKILLIQRDAQEERFPLNKERITIGRSDKCDVVWNEAEFSREHVAIHNKHDIVYVENVSTGGSIRINNKPTEYAELREGAEVIVGPYVLKWIYVNVLDKIQENSVVQSQSGIKAFGEAQSFGSGAAAQSDEDTSPSADLLLGDNLPALESTVQSDSGDIEMSPEVAAAIAEDDTVTQLSAAVGVMRITAGEIVGREIRLEHGKEWIVGRARECHVSVDNPKLSRHHFRILQIGNGFRVQDLDSSYGVKINGVSVKDAPLKSFDKITAGPVEMQFVVADKSLQELPDLPSPALSAPLSPDSLPALMREEAPLNPSARVHSERTNYPPAVSGAAPASFQFSKPSLENSHSQGNFVSVEDKPKKPLPKEQIAILVGKFKAQPRPRQILLLLLPLLILAGILAGLSPEEAAPQDIAQNEAKEEASSTPGEENPAESAETSPEFQLKTKAEQVEIQNLYAQAEEARTKNDWQKAYELAKKVVDRVGKYKRTSEIIAEAQAYLTDLQIATLTRTDNDAESAAAAAKEKVETLLQQGETALNEKRWEDAQEIYSRALLLDPKNETATRGQYAAQAKDSTALGKKLEIEKPVVVEKPVEEAPVLEATADPTLEWISQEYQTAKQKIQEGSYREALPTLSQLKSQIEKAIAEDEASRNPAAAIAEDKRNMRSKIIESLDLINDQFVLEYKTQMDDAQQAIANQKFVEARAIYDTIIKREPLFEEPRIEREKLYRKMITDGQTAYREGLVSESVGDLSTATELYEKAKSYFENIKKSEAEEYYDIIDSKLKVLKK